MAYKKGQVLYWLYVCEHIGEHSWDEFIITCIRKGTIYVVCKDRTTWGKRSSAVGDYGWLPNIANYNRHSFKADDKFISFGTTKLGAWRQAHKAFVKRVKRGYGEYPPELVAKIEEKFKRLKPRKD